MLGADGLATTLTENHSQFLLFCQDWLVDAFIFNDELVAVSLLAHKCLNFFSKGRGRDFLASSSRQDPLKVWGSSTLHSQT